MISDNRWIWQSRVLTIFLSWLVGWPCLVVAEREQESKVRGREISAWERPSNIGLPHTRWFGAERSDLGCTVRIRGLALNFFNI